MFIEDKNYTTINNLKFFDLRKIIMDNFKVSVGLIAKRVESIDEIIDQEVFEETSSFLANTKKSYREMSKVIKFLTKMGVENKFVANFMQTLSRYIALTSHTIMYNNKTIVVPVNTFSKLMRLDPVLELDKLNFTHKAFYVAFDDEIEMDVEVTNFLGGTFMAKLVGVYVFDVTNGIHISCIYNIEDKRSIPFVGMIEWKIEKSLLYESKSDFSKYYLNPLDQQYKKENCGESIEDVTSVVINTISHLNNDKSDLNFIEV